MAFIEIRENESLDDALRRFRKNNERDGISKEIKKRAVYEKPSLVKKRKREALERKIMKKMRKMRIRGISS